MSLNNNKKHIVFLTPGFPGAIQDTSTIPALQFFLKAFIEANKDVKITIITLHFPFKKATYSWHGATVISMGAANCSFPKRFLFWQKTLYQLKNLHKDSKITNIHSFWYSEMAMLGERFSKKHKLLHTVTLMGQDVLSSNKYFHKTKVDLDRVIAISQNQQKELQTHFNTKATTVIPWGIPSFSKIEACEKKYDLITIGSLTSLKNHRLFLEIVQSLKSVYPAISALIIGEGPCLEELKHYAKKLTIENNIIFTGGIDQPKVLDFLSQSKVMIHTSLYESYGFVFNEAIACHVPIVSFNVGAAFENDYWKIAKDKLDFIELAKTFLQNENPSFNETEVFTMKQTVEAYESFWKNKGRT